MSNVSVHPGTRALEDLPGEALDALRAGFGGDVVLPGDERYEEVRQVWNGMIDRYPAVVARCKGTADVVAALNFAREQDLPVAVRGGGHNVSGNAVVDGGLVVDLTPMDGVHVDPHSGTVRAGGGATLGDVDRETQLHGLATALGVVSQTGIAGLTLSGGMGHLRREYGLACDNLRSLEVVTADGEVHTASEDRNPDLFWALRGGGGNFGVATAFEYDCHEVGPEVFGLFVLHPADEAAALLARFREWAADAPREASGLLATAFVPAEEEFPEAAWGDPVVMFFGGFDGDPGEGAAVFRPLREAADPVVDFSGSMPYVQLQQLLDADYPDGRRYYWKSVFLSELTDEVLDLVARFGRESPSKLSTVDLWQLGGAVGEVPPDATAFWHREKPYMLNFEANWEDPDDDDANVEWVRSGIEAARELSVAGGQYGNFPGFNEDPAQLLFGDNYDRLVDVKNEYDPENAFRRNQNVEPTV